MEWIHGMKTLGIINFNQESRLSQNNWSVVIVYVRSSLLYMIGYEKFTYTIIECMGNILGFIIYFCHAKVAAAWLLSCNISTSVEGGHSFTPKSTPEFFSVPKVWGYGTALS